MARFDDFLYESCLPFEYKSKRYELDEWLSYHVGPMFDLWYRMDHLAPTTYSSYNFMHEKHKFLFEIAWSHLVDNSISDRVC